MEGVVLLGVEHFQQGVGGVSLVVLAYLVYLVEDDYGVGAAGTVDALEDTSGHRSDVCPAVTSYLRLVMQSAEGYALILAA